MAGWMATGSFALLIIIVLLLLTCMVLLIVHFFINSNTGCTGMLAPAPSNQQIQTTLSTPQNHGVSFGNASDRDGDFVNRSELNLTKDAFYANLRLDNSTLNTNGYRLFVQGTLTLTNNSVIQNAGRDGGANNAFGQGWVPGGQGGKQGTVGGGGSGGSGALKQSSSHSDKMRGGGSGNVLWGANKTLFSGADGSASSGITEFGVGLAGNVGSQACRAATEAAQALNGSSIPTYPLLSGGSGGGGGQGSNQHPGSGGGGGGGVIVVAARTLIVAKGGGTINAAGGNAGPLLSGGPVHATSGGGGGGGLVLLATLSPPSSYEGLVFNVDGGNSVDGQGAAAQSSPGRVVDWFNPPEKDANTSQFLLAQTSQTQTLTKDSSMVVKFDQVEANSGGLVQNPKDKSLFTVEVGGLYLVHTHLPTKPLPPNQKVQAYVLRNADDPTALHNNHSALVQLQPQDSFQIHVDAPTSLTLQPEAKLTAVLIAAL